MPTAPADRFTLAPRSATTKPPALKSSPTTQEILPKSNFSASSRSSPLTMLPLISSRLPSWFLRSRVLRPQFRLQERPASRKCLSCCPAKSLAWAFGLGHGAVVEERPKHPSDDRPKDVKPYATEIPRNDHRSQRARRIDRPSGHGSRDEHPHRKRKSYRYGSDRGRSPLVCGHSHHHEHQDEGDKDLNHEGLQVSYPLCGVGGRQLRLAPCPCSAEGQPGGQSREDRPHELRHYVVRGVLPGELARCGHTQCDGWVYVRPRDVTYGGHHRSQRKPEGQRYGQRVVSGPSRRAREDRAYSNRSSAEHEYEGPYQLGYGRADDVGGVYLAAVEPSAARLFLLFLIHRPPCAPADALFQSGLFFRADPATSDAGPARRGVAVHASSAASPTGSTRGGSVAGRSAASPRSSSSPLPLSESNVYSSLFSDSRQTHQAPFLPFAEPFLVPSSQASVALLSPGGRCSGGAAAIGIPSSCSPLDNAASSLVINARMRSHSFNTNANLSISSVMPSAPCPLCRRVGSKNSSSTHSSGE